LCKNSNLTVTIGKDDSPKRDAPKKTQRKKTELGEGKGVGKTDHPKTSKGGGCGRRTQKQEVHDPTKNNNEGKKERGGVEVK